MIRLLFIFATGVACALIAIWFVPRFYSGDRLAETVIDEIAASTGYEVIGHGQVDFTTLPIPRLVIHDVQVKARGRDAVLMSADEVSVDLSVLPLVTGRLAPGRIVLVTPVFTLTGEPGADGNLIPRRQGAIHSVVQRVIAGGAAPDDMPVGLGVVTIIDGTVRLPNVSFERREVHDVNVTVEWPSLEDTFAMDASLRWNGHTIGGAVSLDDPMAFFAGTFAPMALRARGDLGDLTFSGRATYAEDIQLDGAIDANLHSLGQWLNWIGYVDEAIEGFDDFRIAADMNLIGTTVALDDLNLSFDGNTGAGVMQVAETDGAFEISATLDFPALDVSGMIRPGDDPSTDVSEPSGGGVAFHDDILKRLTADIRISAGRFKARAIAFDQTAASLVIQDGEISIGIAEAAYQGGRASGTVVFAPGEDGFRVRGQGSLLDVQIGSVIPAPGIMAIEGTGHAALQIESEGETFAAFLGNMNGEARIEVEGGRLRGMNLPAVARALEAGDLAALAPDRRTETGFDHFAARFVIKDGIASTETVEIEGAGVTVDGAAEIDLSRASLTGRGAIAVDASAQDEDADLVLLPFVISGPLDHPLILPDLDRILDRDRSDRATEWRRAGGGGSSPAN